MYTQHIFWKIYYEESMCSIFEDKKQNCSPNQFE